MALMLSLPKCKFMTLHLFPSARGRGFPLRRRRLYEYASSDSVPYDDGTRHETQCPVPAISMIDVSDMVELPSKVDQRPDCLSTGFPTNQLDQPGSTTAKDWFVSSVVKYSIRTILWLSVVKRAGGADGICAWLIGVPLPFTINHESGSYAPCGPVFSRQRSLPSIMVGVEVYSTVMI